MLYVVGVTHPFEGGWVAGYLGGGTVAVAHAVAALRVARHFAAEVGTGGDRKSGAAGDGKGGKA